MRAPACCLAREHDVCNSCRPHKHALRVTLRRKALPGTAGDSTCACRAAYASANVVHACQSTVFASPSMEHNHKIHSMDVRFTCIAHPMLCSANFGSARSPAALVISGNSIGTELVVNPDVLFPVVCAQCSVSGETAIFGIQWSRKHHL